MGGTTAKCALVENGRFSVEFDLLRRRLREGLPDQVVGDRHRRSRLGRRLDRLARSAEAGLHVGPQSAGSTPGPGLLRPRRQRADRDRRQSRARPAQSRPLPRRRAEARRRRGARARSSAIAAAARLHRRGRRDPDGRRHHRARDRDHGRRDQADLGRARARSARVRAVLLWRRRAAARERAGARAVDPDRGHPARARQLLGRRHAARRCAARSVEDLRRACSTTPSSPSAEGCVRRRWKRKRAPRWRATSAPAMCCSSAMPRCAIAGQRHNIKVPISGLDDAAAIRAGLRPRLQAPLRPCRRRATGRIPGAASLRLHAAAAAGPRASAARRSRHGARAQTRPVYFGERRRHGRRRRSIERTALRAGLQRRGSGGDRGIRFDHAGLAGRSFRDRHAAARSAFDCAAECKFARHVDVSRDAEAKLQRIAPRHAATRTPSIRSRSK